MARDKRYNIIKPLIENGQIKSFRDIFEYIPKKIVYQDLGVNYTRFTRLIDHTDLFTLQELITLSKFFEIESRVVIELALAQHEADKKTKKTPAKGKTE